MKLPNAELSQRLLTATDSRQRFSLSPRVRAGFVGMGKRGQFCFNGFSRRHSSTNPFALPPFIAAFAIVLLLMFQSTSFSQSLDASTATHEKYLALSLENAAGKKSEPKITEQFGIPFLEGALKLPQGGSAQVDVGIPVKRIFLIGMTATPNISCWSDPTNLSVRCFIGDEVGKIRLDYNDGSTQVFPLVSGESIWWGKSFYRDPGPFPTNSQFRKALASALRLYPPMPVEDGNYVGVITPRPLPLRSITIESSAAKRATPIINGITLESADTNDLADVKSITAGAIPSEFARFIEKKSLRPVGEGESQAQRQLNDLRLALYSSVENVRSRLAPETPSNYSGPRVSFKGNRTAEILANAFSFNVQDIADKIDSGGMYHTSTKGALLWGDNGGQFGTYRTNAGIYYPASWTRDMGRSLQELTILGYTNEAARCADYCLRMARLWQEDPTLKVNGESFPPHWSRIANRPKNAPPFENDGHGLVTMFLYKLWQRIPERDAWLRSRWPDIKAAGDWILWQFDHPEISGASNGVLHTTGECAAGNGYSVYADYVCMDALQALAQMAESVGQTNCATQWRDRATQMRQAMVDRYVINDPKYGRVWTLDFAGWPTHPTVLGPLIFVADYQGFAPDDDDSNLRAVNEAAYQRLIDTYHPFGFYGQAMGYGQGFVTQSALLLDRMRDATSMMDWIAKEIYDPKFGSFIVPEGVQIDPSGQFLYRAGDLGNGVQEAEIVKALRLVIGIDDTQPARLRFYPRMPYGWTEMAVEKYPVLSKNGGKMETALLHYKLSRRGKKMALEIASDRQLGLISVRLGPFDKPPGASSVRVNGKDPESIIEHGGDSWWVKFTISIESDARVTTR